MHARLDDFIIFCCCVEFLRNSVHEPASPLLNLLGQKNFDFDWSIGSTFEPASLFINTLNRLGLFFI